MAGELEGLDIGPMANMPIQASAQPAAAQPAAAQSEEAKQMAELAALM